MPDYKHPDIFRHRHIGPSAAETSDMLKTVGSSTLDELINETVPSIIRMPDEMELPEAMTEQELLIHVKSLASMNKVYSSYIGMGYYNTFTPAVIQRNILESPGWYTQYTPYQAEIAQGRLEALLNFQTMILDLTGMEITNASLLDEGTSAAEAMTMLYGQSRTTKPDAHTFLVVGAVFPQTIDVLLTRSAPLGISVKCVDHVDSGFDSDVFGVFVQYPDGNGNVRDISGLLSDAKQNGIFSVVAADLLSLTLLKPPGEMGADVVVGTTQRFGVPMMYGGPHAGYFATRDAFKRFLPGRIIGVSVDANGKRALRMALQTREQHIRRDKATSNICTAQVLLAIMASMYAVYHGPARLKSIAERIHHLAGFLSAGLKSLGFSQSNDYFFDTLKVDIVSSHVKASDLSSAAINSQMNFRYFDDGSVGISLDESTRITDVYAILSVFAKVSGQSWTAGTHNGHSTAFPFPGKLVRTTPYLTHPVFNSYHSETEMLRYIKRLETKDLALNVSMIPLGSCTMKLNATSEMIPVSWPEFANLHPFVPFDQARGYGELVCNLGQYLCEITGFKGISFQPNSGAQGEYAGLMVIREYLKSREEHHRNVVLIPSSAHGTNPASAVMAGMQVVVVACDSNGNIDVSDLKEKADQYRENLAALMVTYPSTHGVFEASIIEICAYIHKSGGQVYMDGANMNAQVGLTSPAIIGADVCHLNLHKTFCIPHGGGGPGVGPICVAEHLTSFLPGHAVVKAGGQKGIPAVSSAPYGSAGILVISYAYIRMMGPDGLTDATKYAILNANYIKARLDGHYSVLYSGQNGRIAHEAIFDLRSYKAVGVEAEDVAKRLMDYGYHAPTVSFPVAGTIMIEPTESEAKAELDKFCDALISIRNEIREIENETADKVDNVLKNSPHPAYIVTADEWNHSYSRSKAAFPLPSIRENKFWPAIARVNNAHGDRNLICSCPPVESYMETEA